MSVAVAQAASATHTRAGERGVHARDGQFRMMCSSAIVPACVWLAKTRWQENASQVNLEIHLRHARAFPGAASAGSEQRMQASAATAAAAAEAVAMESSDSDSCTEDDDAQPAQQWTRATAQNLSLSCVACRQHLRRDFLWEAKVHRARMIWGSFLVGLTRPEFSRMFRMDHATFESVVERLSHRLQRLFAV